MKHLSGSSALALWKVAEESAERRHESDDFSGKTKKEVYALGFFKGAEASIMTSRGFVSLAEGQTGLLAFLLSVSNIAWLVAYMTR